MRASRAIAWAVLAAELALTSVAHAEDPAAAEALFQEARALIEAEHFDEACAKLAASEALDPGIGTQFNLARCYELSGRTASAWSIYERVSNETRAAGQRAREDAARRRLADLAPRLRRIRIQVSPGGRIAGLELTLDGLMLAAERWGEEERVDPGVHMIGATAPRYRAWEQKVEVAEGASVTIEVPALTQIPHAIPSSAPPPAMAPPALPPPPRASSARRVLGFVTGGAGIAALGTGLVLGVRSWALYAGTDGQCIGNTCSPQAFAQRKDAIQSGDIATVLSVAGGAAIAAGAVIFLTSPSPHEPALRATPFLSADRGGVVFSTSW